MKKIFAILMMLVLSLSLFACNPETSDKRVSFEVEDDSQTVVEYTETTDKNIENTIAAFEPDEEVPAETITSIKMLLGFTKLNEKDVTKLAKIIQDNKDLFKKLANEEKLVRADVQGLIDIYNDVYEVVGKDTLGKFLYGMINSGMMDAEPAAVEIFSSITYETLVIESRMIMTMLTSAINSISSSDIDAILAVVYAENPTSAQFASLIKVLADAVNSIAIKESVWVEYCEHEAKAIGKILDNKVIKDALEEEFNGMITVEQLKGAVNEVFKNLGKSVPAYLNYIEEVLLQLDEPTLDILTAETDVEWSYTSTTYKINGNEVTKQEYDNFAAKQTITTIDVFYDAYEELSSGDQDKVIGLLESVLSQTDSVVEEIYKKQANVSEGYKYTGVQASFEDLLNGVKAITELDLNSANLETELENKVADLQPTLLCFIGTETPNIYYLFIMSGRMK